MSPSGRQYGNGYGQSIAAGQDLDPDGVPDVVVGSGGDDNSVFAYSGRDGALIHQIKGISNGGGSGMGDRVEVLRPQPGNPFPLFVSGESGFTFPKSTFGGVGQVWLCRGAPAGVTPYGAPCAGTLPQQPRIGMRELHAAVTGQPNLGVRIHLSDGEPGGSAVLLLGLSRTSLFGRPLPYPLGYLGFPGCVLLTSMEATIPVRLGSSGLARGYAFADLSTPLATAGAEGVTLYGQWVALDSSRAFGGGTSAALSWRH